MVVARARGEHLRHPGPRPCSRAARRPSCCATSPRACAAHRLLLFGPLDAMVRTWGAAHTREFFARCCPMLLEDGAIAYWSMSARRRAAVRETVHAVTQCVLRVDERNVHVVEGRGARRRGARLGPALARGGRAAGALAAGDRRAGGGVVEGGAARPRAQPARPRRSGGRDRERDLAGRAGGARPVARDAGAAERGAARDDRRPAARRGAQRVPDRPALGGRALADAARRATRTSTSCTSARARRARPTSVRSGQGIIAVASGLVQLTVAGQTPALRHGEVLVDGRLAGRGVAQPGSVRGGAVLDRYSFGA